MKIEFTQEGQSLRLTSDSKPVQFGDNIPVAIAVDTEYSSFTDASIQITSGTLCVDTVGKHGVRND